MTHVPRSLDSQRAKCVLLAGATGTMGQAVASCLIAEGYEAVCLVRPGSKGTLPLAARRIEIALDDAETLAREVTSIKPAAVISCIASRSGAPKDAWAVDHDANANLLAAAEGAGVEHFVLLSAICVQKPHLAFQHAKLAFEAKLKTSPVDHTIVRPTAFFKSLSGQVDRLRQGKPFMVFGNGELTRCKPISDADCARFVVDCLEIPERRGAILPIGGPGPAITMREQGALLFEAIGKEPRYRSISPAMFGIFAGVLGLFARWSDWMAQKSEYARIAHYYATESMLFWDAERGVYSAEATPEFGSDTLAEHYQSLAG